MNVRTTKQLIMEAAKAELQVPILLIGAMGIGKSQIVKQVAEELNIGFVDLRLAQQEPGDLIGIPRVVDGVTAWARPSWFPDPKKQPRGILFLDELNRAPVDVRQAVFQLVKEWRMHTHELPKGWYICSAINPDNSSYQVETLDKAMLRRFCQIKMTSDVETWLNWAKGPGKVDDKITGFIGANRKLLGEDEKFTVEAKPTPDQYKMLDMMQKANVIPKREEVEVFTGLIGQEAAVAYVKWIDAEYQRPVSGKEILNDFKSVAKKLKKQRNDENHATILDLSAEMNVNLKPTKDQIKNLAAFILDSGAETQASVVHKLPKEYLTELVGFPDVTEVITNIQDKVAN